MSGPKSRAYLPRHGQEKQREDGIPVNRTRFEHMAAALLVVAALAGTSGIAIAQTPDAGADDEIIVEAPRSVPVRVERSPYSGAPIVVTTVKISVLYSDLDLKDPASAPRLMRRVERVAQDACAQLDRLHPLNPDPRCVATAVANGTKAAKAAIASAAK